MVEAATTIETDTAADVEPVEEESEPIEAEVDAEPSAGDTVEIVVDVVAKTVVPDDLPVSTIRERLDKIDEVVQGMYEHLLDIPVQWLDDIEKEQRAQETRAVIADTKRARLLDMISVLEGSNIRLRDALSVERERERADSVQRLRFICLIIMIGRALGDLSPS
ncbi:hypothetical protein Tco_1463152 [Tanacetum coccineum]